MSQQNINPAILKQLDEHHAALLGEGWKHDPVTETYTSSTGASVRGPAATATAKMIVAGKRMGQ